MQTLKPILKFNYHDVSVTISDKQLLKAFIKELFLIEKKGLLSLNYVFCNDNYLLEINKKYLNHDYLTDIITFDLSDNGLTEGEIYISIERVKENAGSENCTFKEELLRVVFHGALHLCGYKDKTISEKKIMRSKENYYLARYLNPSSFVSRETKWRLKLDVPRETMI